MSSISERLKYYNQSDILKEMLRISENREVIFKFDKGFFSKRPNTILYSSDIITAVRKGAVSFHMSVERWNNPLSLNQTNSKKYMDELRVGWDLILDIDTKFIEYAVICSKLLSQAIKFHGIDNFSIKYSGGTGFHIGIPYESFPEYINGLETRKMFPEGAQIIAAYLSELIKDKLADFILEIDSIENIIKKTGKNMNELIVNGKLNPYLFIEIDSIAINSRHLIRMNYSINEKTGNVSVPISEEDLEDFSPEMAKMNSTKYSGKFLDGTKSKKNEAKELFICAFDWHKKLKEKTLYKKKENIVSTKSNLSFSKEVYRVPKEEYPPCINNILKGLEDGKKRSLFLLLNYFLNAGYDINEIEKIVNDWNKKNPEKLRQSYINGQLNYYKKRKSSFPPPNCSNNSYYGDLGICKKDEICEKIKNPLNYSFYKHKKDKFIAIKKDKDTIKKKKIDTKKLKKKKQS